MRDANATGRTLGGTWSRSEIDCHSERSEESTRWDPADIRGRGFFAALRM